jgi:NTP pyrophosphatase (non-canonical NTP hydrolase)
MTDDDTSIGALRARLRAFTAARAWGRYHSPRNLAMAVNVEAGELLELYLWSADEGPQPPVAARGPRVAEEAADVLLSLLNFCEAAGIDLTAAAEAKLARNAEKYPVGTASGRLEKWDELPGAAADQSPKASEASQDEEMSVSPTVPDADER